MSYILMFIDQMFNMEKKELPHKYLSKELYKVPIVMMKWIKDHAFHSHCWFFGNQASLPLTLEHFTN